jgi:creatinine amidohydrolase
VPERSLARLTWPEAGEGGGRSVVAVPVGSTEQHGPHLPLSTDTCIASELCRRLAGVRDDVVVAPALPYGASGEHASFPGTLSVGHEALFAVLVELGRSADAFAGVVFVSAHGGNSPTLSRAAALLVGEGRAVRAWSLPAGGHPGADAHAGHTETSVMLALHPDMVGEGAPGNIAPLSALAPDLRRGGVAAVSANGVLGDPTTASAEAGLEILERWAEDLVSSLEGWP